MEKATHSAPVSGLLFPGLSRLRSLLGTGVARFTKCPDWSHRGFVKQQKRGRGMQERLRKAAEISKPFFLWLPRRETLLRVSHLRRGVASKAESVRSSG